MVEPVRETIERTQQKQTFYKPEKGSIRSQDAVWDEEAPVQKDVAKRARSALRSNPAPVPADRNKVVSKTASSNKKPAVKKKAVSKKKVSKKPRPARNAKGQGPTGKVNQKHFEEMLAKIKHDIDSGALEDGSSFTMLAIRKKYGIGDTLIRKLRTELRKQNYLKKKGRSHVVTKPAKAKLALVN